MPGKAYVRGYEIEKPVTYLDVEKPRSTVGVPTSGINVENGTTVKINNISGLPLIGFNENSIIEFRSERRNETTGEPWHWWSGNKSYWIYYCRNSKSCRYNFK